MRQLILLLPLLALISTAAQAARPVADRDDSVHMSCVVEYRSTAKKAVEVTPIMRLTVPWMPAGSSEASTRTFVEASFRELMLQRDSSLYKTYCLTGVTLAEVRERIASWDARQGPGHKKVALDPENVFPQLFDRMYGGQRIGRPEITRARYIAVLIEPHGK